MMTAGGMQLVSNSYILPRTWYKRFGLCSSRISLTISLTYSSQSVSCATCSSETCCCCTLQASNDSNAFLKLRFECFATLTMRSCEHLYDSFFATSSRNCTVSSNVAPGTRIAWHLLSMASMTLEGFSQQSTSLQAELYFSMVRRRECWASLLRESTSFRMITLTPLFPVTSRGLLLAISLITSCTTYLSRYPASLGVSSM
mmetsp:Transcript_11/g.79  ORF Transcript_11/g.79 Transcript_11/m.79 type:complete len:201 (+) Transcript_11:1775-2377(+)